MGVAGEEAGAGASEAGDRDRHLFAPGPKRILSLDGGGTRGIVTLAFLLALEERLGREAGAEVRLADHFDLIGGTSTGAIIATGLALGWRVADIIAFYRGLAPKVFRSRWWRVPGLAARYDARALNAVLAGELGSRTLDTPDLLTGLAIVTRRLDTASNWVIVNNPRGTYWNTPADGSYTGNRHYCLSQLVRASTAAPTYFAPELIEVGPNVGPGLFIDGALTPHNNPALMLLMVARLRGFRLNWPGGADRLSITSVGTGSYRMRASARQLHGRGSMMLGLAAFESAMNADGRFTLSLLQAMSEPERPWQVDGEMGDLSGDLLGADPLFAFERLDVLLEADNLAALGHPATAREIDRLRRIDNVADMDRLFAVASAAAALQLARAAD